MKQILKRVIDTIFIVAGVTFLGGGATFVLYLLGNFGMFPLYVTKVIPVVGIAGTVALLLICTGFLKPAARKWVGRVFLLVCILSVGYIGHGIYTASLPTVDDRSLLVQEYQPFRKQDGKLAESKLVQLEEPATFSLDNPWKLRMDGATALYPVYAAFVEATFPQQDYSPHHSTVECSGTSDAYRKLIHGERDMIFAAGPSEAQLKAAEANGVELHLTPIGREAFVFFVNSKNPVESLTVEQIQGIYTGEITNWKHLGGRFQVIRPFQRAEGSGSQTSLQKLMQGLPLMEPEEEERIAGMGGIIKEVASYRNHSNAIGFSFRYYATEMVKNGDIRLLAINGVEPTKETIRDGSYPIASEFYAVTAAPIGKPAPQETNETMAAFLEWILSEQGQWIIEETGYVSLK